MAYKIDPNNEQTNRNLAKMGKDIDNTNKGCFTAIFVLALIFIIFLMFV